jgi:hypothetical protein
MPMSDEDKTFANPDLRKCTHCQQEMQRWYTPPDSTWGTVYQYICFNDACGYYIRGWDWIEKTYNKKASYRHRYNPFGGDAGPIPVWSPTALRENIIPEGMDPDTFIMLRAQSGKNRIDSK